MGLKTRSLPLCSNCSTLLPEHGSDRIGVYSIRTAPKFRRFITVMVSSASRNVPSITPARNGGHLTFP